MKNSPAQSEQIKDKNLPARAFCGHGHINVGLTCFFMPAHWRASFPDSRVFATMGFEGQIVIFPEAAWTSFYQNLLRLGMAASGFKRIASSYAEETQIEPDGSLMVSGDLIKACGIKRKAIMVGVGQNVEMWSPKRYAAITAQQPDMNALANFRF